MDKDDLKKLIEEDDLGLLNVRPKVSPKASADQRLIASFREINEFVRDKGAEPQANKSDVKEMRLYSRLSGLRCDPEKAEQLRDFDEFGLLSDLLKPLESLQDVFSDDDLGLLEDEAERIFQLENVPNPKTIANLPDYIARRKPCNDFDKFEHLFKQCQADLSAGNRALMPFTRGSQINKGDFFVLKGVLVYVADEGERHPTADRNTFNARLRCVFENGTESDMLLRSLAAALYKEDGRRISAHKDKLYHSVNEISDDDRQTGFVYVLKSLSDKAEIRSLKHLYKIGFCRGPVEDRIKNAQKETTYLMAHVSIVTAYQCYNFHPHTLENLLHSFFGKACLQVEVTDSAGKRCVPKEWFVAPLSVITKAVELLISGEIVKYKYDPQTQQIELRERTVNSSPSTSSS